MKTYYVYILDNERGTLYTGVTNDLIRRVYEHKEKFVPGFTSKYNITKLLYYEDCGDAYEAIQREKRLKKWRREWKENLINEMNPGWRALWPDIIGMK